MNNILSPYNYPYCEFSFLQWNPVQLKCYPFFTQDYNLVVSASTASGKTIIAEAIVGYELSKNNFNKAVYVSPLKAIGLQKYNEWNKHPTFQKYNKILVSSDNDVKSNEFDNARLIVSTIESMNLRCRSRDRWIRNVKVLIFDEAHLINDESRGAGSESLIMSLTQLNPDCRIICLSGTMSNYIDIAKWLKACNNKTTKFINSNWRPTELIKKVQLVNDFNEQKEYILNLSKQVDEQEQKMLIFVHSKVTGQKLCKYLKEYGINTTFYYAGLKQNIRENIIYDFKNEYSGLNILICTSSLSMGIDI